MSSRSSQAFTTWGLESSKNHGFDKTVSPCAQKLTALNEQVRQLSTKEGRTQRASPLQKMLEGIDSNKAINYDPPCLIFSDSIEYVFRTIASGGVSSAQFARHSAWDKCITFIQQRTFLANFRSTIFALHGAIRNYLDSTCRCKVSQLVMENTTLDLGLASSGFQFQILVQTYCSLRLLCMFI